MSKETDDRGNADDKDLPETSDQGGGGAMTTLVTGAAVAVLAPELLPGMAIGVAAMFAPRLLPVLGAALRPLIRPVVKAGYAAAVKTWEMGAEVSEHVQDLVAEAQVEHENNQRAVKARRGTRRPTKRRRPPA